MPRAGVYVLASLISGVSAALISASAPSYIKPRQGTVHNVKQGQSTFDECRASPSQIVYLNSAEDFCLWAPSQPALSATRNTEVIAWCMQSAHGTHLIPNGTISAARLVITPAYVQVTGVGNMTNINVPTDGVASASGEGDRVHGLVFTSAYGQLEQVYDWTSFVSQERFCFRACKPSAVASTSCSEIHDVFGCLENLSENYDTGMSEDCIGDAMEVPSTLYQDVLVAPLHHSALLPSSCTTRGNIDNTQATHARRAIAPILVTSRSYWHFRTQSHNIPITSSIAPTTMDTATMTSFPTSALTATTLASSRMPVSSNAPMFTPHSQNHTRHPHSFTLSTSASSPSSIFTPAPTPTPSSPFSYGASSSFSGLSSSPPSSYYSSTSSSVATPTPSPTSPSTSSSSSSTSSQSAIVLTFSTPSSTSVPTTSPASPSPTVPNSQTQIGSQCPPPLRVALNAGSVGVSTPLLPLVFTILMIVASSSVGVLIL
ncbi:hypothetical protein HD554DRAFT_2173200 [Boletus coccyginus]|nr:hypothetical protein HD554DRAFT_2173200 [Boletus coccyginus]